MELDLFSLECNEVSSSEFWGVSGFGMALAACLLMLRSVPEDCELNSQTPAYWEKRFILFAHGSCIGKK